MNRPDSLPYIRDCSRRPAQRPIPSRDSSQTSQAPTSCWIREFTNFICNLVWLLYVWCFLHFPFTASNDKDHISYHKMSTWSTHSSIQHLLANLFQIAHYSYSSQFIQIQIKAETPWSVLTQEALMSLVYSLVLDREQYQSLVWSSPKWMKISLQIRTLLSEHPKVEIKTS